MCPAGGAASGRRLWVSSATGLGQRMGFPSASRPARRPSGLLLRWEAARGGGAGGALRFSAAGGWSALRVLTGPRLVGPGRAVFYGVLRPFRWPLVGAPVRRAALVTVGAFGVVGMP